MLRIFFKCENFTQIKNKCQCDAVLNFVVKLLEVVAPTGPEGGGDDGRADALNPPGELPAGASGAGLLELFAGATGAKAGLLIAGPTPVAGGGPNPGACAEGAAALTGGGVKPLLGSLSTRAGVCSAGKFVAAPGVVLIERG